MTRAEKAGLALAVVVALVLGGLWYQFAPAGPGAGGFALAYSVAGDRATIWAVGDGADGGSEARAVVRRIRAGPVDRLLYLGDVYERGSEYEFRDNYATTYGPLAPITAPTPGNHDWPRHASGYDRYWRTALRRERTASWYAFRAAGWTILSLNSEATHARGSPQERWLRSRLSKPGTCRIAFWHRPRFSAGAHHGDRADMAPIHDALRGKAAIVLNGHEHNMQRLHPIDGITTFISGAGGHSHHRLRSDDPRLAFGDDRHDGALRLQLRRGVARYAYITSAGRVLDRGTVRCRPLRSGS